MDLYESDLHEGYSDKALRHIDIRACKYTE